MIICRLHEADLRDINLTGHELWKKRITQNFKFLRFFSITSV